MTPGLPTLLQLCDSLFPIGAFSHSDGLEAATASGRLVTAADLALWMEALREDSLRTFEGPAVQRAWQLSPAGDLHELRRIDDELHAMRPSASGRDAFRAMGARLLKTWQQLRPSAGVERLITLRSQWTLPAAFGVVCAVADVAERDAVAGYAYTRLAATLSAAMRLIPLGQHEGHRLLAAQLDRVPALLDAIAFDGTIRNFMPAMDVAAMSQQYVHSRLFRS